jgi:nitrate reductase cytochrome c-type subunit
MKNQNARVNRLAGLMAAILAFAGTVATINAAPPALNGQVEQRPLTPNEISQYGLTNAQFSAGINNVGVGEPVYLDALVNNSIAPSNIVGVVWSLPTTNKPLGSAAVLLNSPLGANVPLYNPADRFIPNNTQAGALVFQLAGRTFFRPDVVGQYTVLATITTVGSGTTNIAVTITAATYLGISACADCHSGGLVGVPSIYPTWTNTPHATFFTRAIDGLVSSYYNQSCIACHVVGYDTNSFAVNGGFDDLAKLLNWNFPSVLTNGNWAAMPPQLQNLANIQCENCHGPGSQHLYSSGVVGNTNAIAISYNAGDCTQCHDSLPEESQAAEWYNSLHAVTTRLPSGSASRMACVRCHTAPGFINYVANLGSPNAYATNVVYEAINCQTCHDPHDASNPAQLRTSTTVAFNGNTGFVVTNAGLGGFCMNCHNSRNGSVSNSIVNYALAQQTWNGGSAFGPHDSPQGDMLEGVNAVTYGQVIPSAPHATVVSNTCVGCHMQPIASTDPAFTLAGGHSMEMHYTNRSGVNVDVTYVCAQCHGAITNFNFPVPDYVGYGYSQGVQTQVQILLNQLSMLLPPSGYQANPSNYVADGLVKSPSTQTNWPTQFLQAAYNWQFVSSDGSLGIHNAFYAIGLLKASIANLTGVSTTGGLPDAWEIHYFGSGFATNAIAAPDAINNSAGFPNWMMYALGLDPRSTPTVTGSGVVFFNGNNIVNGAANTIAIYTAAEIAFNTKQGVNYQIQGISALTGSWQNVSTNIPGTGGSISYVTPTRNNAQMFFRVVHTP